MKPGGIPIKARRSPKPRATLPVAKVTPTEIPEPYRYLIPGAGVELYLTPDDLVVGARAPELPRTWWLLRGSRTPRTWDPDEAGDLYEIHADDSVIEISSGRVMGWTAGDLRDWDDEKHRPGKAVVLRRSAGVRTLADLEDGAAYWMPYSVVRAQRIDADHWRFVGEDYLGVATWRYENGRMQRQTREGGWETAYVLLSDLGIAEEPKQKAKRRG